MNSVEFTAELSKALQIPKTEITKRMLELAEIISAELINSKDISLGNLGTLTLHKRDERLNVNPSTGKRMLVPPKLIVKFKVSSSLKEKVKTFEP